MIKKLTAEQVDALSVYREKWLNIGLDTKQVAFADALKVRDCVEKLLDKKYPVTILMDSPLSAWMAVCMFLNNQQVEEQVGAQVRAQVRTQVGAQVRAQVEEQVWEQVGAQVWEQVWAQVRAQVRGQVGAQVREQVGEQVRKQVWTQVGAQVWAQVREQVRMQVGMQVWEQVGAQVRTQVGEQVEAQVKEQVREQVESQVGAQVESQVREQVRGQVGAQVREQVGAPVWAQVGNFIWPYLDGHFYSSYFAYYDYCNSVLNLPSFSPLWTDYIATTRVGLIYPLKNGVIIMCNRPTTIKMQNGQLHCEDGPAIAYADGFAVFILNGVRVPKTLVLTPAEELNPEIILKEKNAEVRREIVRKIGIDRVVQGLGAKIIDSWQ